MVVSGSGGGDDACLHELSHGGGVMEQMLQDPAPHRMGGGSQVGHRLIPGRLGEMRGGSLPFIGVGGIPEVDLTSLAHGARGF